MVIMFTSIILCFYGWTRIDLGNRQNLSGKPSYIQETTVTVDRILIKKTIIAHEFILFVENVHDHSCQYCQEKISVAIW